MPALRTGSGLHGAHGGRSLLLLVSTVVCAMRCALVDEVVPGVTRVALSFQHSGFQRPRAAATARARAAAINACVLRCPARISAMRGASQVHDRWPGRGAARTSHHAPRSTHLHAVDSRAESGRAQTAQSMHDAASSDPGRDPGSTSSSRRGSSASIYIS